MRQGRFDDAELEQHLNARGFMIRFFGPLRASGRRAVEDVPDRVPLRARLRHRDRGRAPRARGDRGGRGLPFWAILSLPILFAAGMSLLDTLDGSFMNFAYGWAFSKPVRKVYYNIAITGLSVVVAFFIGTLELLRSSPASCNLRGGFWDFAKLQHQRRRASSSSGSSSSLERLALAIWRFGRVERVGSGQLRSRRRGT